MLTAPLTMVPLSLLIVTGPVITKSPSLPDQTNPSIPFDATTRRQVPRFASQPTGQTPPSAQFPLASQISRLSPLHRVVPSTHPASVVAPSANASGLDPSANASPAASSMDGPSKWASKPGPTSCPRRTSVPIASCTAPSGRPPTEATGSNRQPTTPPNNTDPTDMPTMTVEPPNKVRLTFLIFVIFLVWTQSIIQVNAPSSSARPRNRLSPCVTMHLHVSEARCVPLGTLKRFAAGKTNAPVRAVRARRPRSRNCERP